MAGRLARRPCRSLVGTARVNTPDEFYAAVGKSDGNVTLQVYRGTERLESISITEK